MTIVKIRFVAFCVATLRSVAHTYGDVSEKLEAFKAVVKTSRNREAYCHN